MSEIPCFRNSYLYGLSGGIGIGLLTFMGTSRSMFSMHVGFSSFVVGTMSYWFWCRLSSTISICYFFSFRDDLYLIVKYFIDTIGLSLKERSESCKRHCKINPLMKVPIWRKSWIWKVSESVWYLYQTVFSINLWYLILCNEIISFLVVFSSKLFV